MESHPSDSPIAKKAKTSSEESESIYAAAEQEASNFANSLQEHWQQIPARYETSLAKSKRFE
jgi:hypothetical protein